MEHIIPKGEPLRNAVKWVSEKSKEKPEVRFSQLINEVATKYNLSPKDEEFLRVFYLKDADNAG